jgi:NADH-quinone oxidoreductase subunit A
VGEFWPVQIYGGLVLMVVLAMAGLSALIPANRNTPVKYMPYESGIQTETHLLRKRFPLRHYLVGLMFLIIDVEVIFLYPWALVAQSLGPFAFYEMLFFLIAMMIAFIYVWRKGGLQWE